MADVEKDLANLAIADAEEDILQLGVPEAISNFSFKNCFVGSFLTSSVINFQSMRSTLANVWHPIGGISISELGDGRFLFRLYYAVDAERIERGGPWNFNNHLLILHRLVEGEDPMEVPLTHISIWVLIHNLPHGFMSEAVARIMGNFLGSFLEYDATTIQKGHSRIMRIRARIDIGQPIKRRRKIGLPNGNHSYARFEYEKLTIFCFICGLLGHGESFCPLRALHPSRIFTFEWDASLRAPSRRNATPKSRWLIEESPAGVPEVQMTQRGNQVAQSTRPNITPLISGGIRIIGEQIEQSHVNHGSGQLLPGDMMTNNYGKSTSNAAHGIILDDISGGPSGSQNGPQAVGLGPIRVYTNPIMDVVMELDKEDDPLTQPEGIKRARIHNLVSDVVLNLDSKNVSDGFNSDLSAGLHAQASRGQ
ncbi:hypothetical protein HRI_002541700 [Hibiscus trionum]|uniref:DUF4283 domain-containing protein n=1 Tax=Hibiscus trionum TaxID=183268 RepID=A0A9W7I1S6_HIBTR|nr:hypothetical protein HRI_002541700 [Hibiscus trionum]